MNKIIVLLLAGAAVFQSHGAAFLGRQESGQPLILTRNALKLRKNGEEQRVVEERNKKGGVDNAHAASSNFVARFVKAIIKIGFHGVALPLGSVELVRQFCEIGVPESSAIFVLVAVGISPWLQKNFSSLSLGSNSQLVSATLSALLIYKINNTSE